MTRTQLFWSATLLFAAVGLHSCTKDITSEVMSEGIAPQLASKMIHTSEDAIAGTLMVEFSDEALEIVEASATRAKGTMTRAGIVDVDEALELIGTYSLTPVFRTSPSNEARHREYGLHRWYTIEFDEAQDLDEAATLLAKTSAVNFVEFNSKLVPIAPQTIVPASQSHLLTRAGSQNYPAFNDPQLDLQWNYINTGDSKIYEKAKAGADVNCAAAWQLCTGDPRVVVAVVDQPVDWQHPDLAANMWVNEAEANGVEGVDDDGNGFVDDIHGYNFIDNGPLKLGTDPNAANEHGTHIAGTIAAVNNNGIGVAGIAGGSGNGDGVRLMSCQVFRGNLLAGTKESAAAMQYAADNGAVILQCSYGYSPQRGPKSDAAYSEAYSLETVALNYFMNKQNCDAVDGGIMIFAAGNEATAHSCYPGAYRTNVSVTATSCDFTPAYYTNYSYGCNVAAPGGDAYQSYRDKNAISKEASMILSTVLHGEYGYSQGTSMACPHVSGVAALGLSYALQQGKKFTRDQFLGLLTTSVNNIDAYCTGTKKSDIVNGSSMGSLIDINLSNYQGQMGSGNIDAFKMMMTIKGVTCITVNVGAQATIDVKPFLGNVTAVDVEIAAEDMTRLGIVGKPQIFGGKIMLTCGKVGACVMKVKLQAGTNSGSGISGIIVEKEIAIVAREAQAANGGWL